QLRTPADTCGHLRTATDTYGHQNIKLKCSHITPTTTQLQPTYTIPFVPFHPIPATYARSMALIVQKYGGTSVGNPERIRNVASRVAKHRAQGDQIVVVVSAMSGVTDNLIKLAKEIMPLPSERELDMLLATGEQTTIALTAMALHSLDIKAVSLTGAPAGILTNGVHTKAKIQNITQTQIHALLHDRHVVIIERL